MDGGDGARGPGRPLVSAVLGGIAVLAGGAVLAAGLIGGLLPHADPGDDAASPIPFESWNPGVGGSDGAPLGENGEALGTVPVLVDFKRPSEVTALRLTPKDHRCAFDQLDGDPEDYFRQGWAVVFLYGLFITPYDECTTGRSWATWTLTASYLDSITRSTTVRISYSAPGLPRSVVVSCGLDGDLDCVSGSVPFDSEHGQRAVVTVRVE